VKIDQAIGHVSFRPRLSFEESCPEIKMSEPDFTELLGIYYRSLALVIIGLSIYIIYWVFQEKSPKLRYFFVTSQIVNITWQCSIFLRYFDPLSYRIITALTPLMLVANYLAITQILEIYNILDPDRITPRLLLIMRSVAVIMATIMFGGLAFFQQQELFNFIFSFLVTGAYIVYDQIQSLYLLYLVYVSKGDLKSQLRRPFRLVTLAILAINVFDYGSLGLFYYSVMILPKYESVFPFLVNIAGLHSIAIVLIFFRLKALTFAETTSTKSSFNFESVISNAAHNSKSDPHANAQRALKFDK
jgi:hypothetical protein